MLGVFFAKRTKQKSDNPANRCAARLWSVHLFYQHMTRRSKLCIACSDFFSKVRARSRRCSSFPKKVTLAPPVRLQARSRRLWLATNLFRANRAAGCFHINTSQSADSAKAAERITCVPPPVFWGFCRRAHPMVTATFITPSRRPSNRA